MPQFQINRDDHKPTQTVHAPNEIWALELYCKRQGFTGGLDEYLQRRANGERLPNVRATEVVYARRRLAS